MEADFRGMAAFLLACNHCLGGIKFCLPVALVLWSSTEGMAVLPDDNQIAVDLALQ